MAEELFYELRNGKVLIYNPDGFPLPGEEQHLRYLTQASVVAGEIKDLGEVLRQIISEQMPRISRRIKHRDTPVFEFLAVPFDRDCQPTELPRVSGNYANPYSRAGDEERM